MCPGRWHFFPIEHSYQVSASVATWYVGVESFGWYGIWTEQADPTHDHVYSAILSLL